MRGLYTASLFSTLSRRFDVRFGEEEPDIGNAFQLICGTSTGAILACGLAAGVPLGKIRDFYIRKGLEIFPDPSPKRKGVLRWCFRYRKKPAAVVEAFREALEGTFGEMTIQDVYEKRHIALCIPAVKAINHQARVIKTSHLEGKHRDDRYRLVDVCLASTAAPIFFPLARVLNPDDSHNVQHFVDGGLWANNPVMVGLIEALGMTGENTPIELVSAGTCDQPTGDPNLLKNADWGLKEWKVGIGILEMAMSAQSSGYGFMARMLAGYLKRAGRNIKVMRLEEPKKSPEHYSAIGLDRADEVAVRTLLSLAEADADRIHSKAMRDDPGELVPIREIFSNLSVLPRETP
ncbi:MAG: patatin-like phospholipase family protein [Deltaproteobacteria bacterium]|nr:patatin-like phospholipase family protein [Deltaproteobacteria bacterium]